MKTKYLIAVLLILFCLTGTVQAVTVGSKITGIESGVTFEMTQSDPNNLAVSIQDMGSNTYSIERADITTVSVNLPFGFTSKMIMLWADSSNTADVAIDFLGGTAIAPAANTAGDGLLPPGAIMTLPNYAVTSISVIAASGTQTIRVYAFK